MRTSSNPAFRNLPGGIAAGGPYGGMNQPQGGLPGRGTPQAPSGVGERPMTIDDVVMKSAASIGVALITGIISAIWAIDTVTTGGDTGPLFAVMIVSMLVGFGLVLYISFKQKASAALTLTYSAVEGVFLGTISGVFEMVVEGVAFQAIMGTALVFVVMLVVYRTGAVKVTPKLTKWIIGATAAAAGLVLVNLLLSLLGFESGLRGNGTLGIIIGVVFIGIAAFNLLLDFDMADNMIRAGMPQKWAWFAAFGLMVTLVWLYFEMIRLLTILQSE